MSDIATIENREIAIRLGVALLPQMPEVPVDPQETQRWHDHFESALSALVETVAVNTPQELERSLDFQRQMAEFYDPDNRDKRPLFAEIIDVIPGRSRNTIVASTGFGKVQPTVEEATAAYLERGGQTADFGLFREKGVLKTEYGLELFRTPYLREADGRGNAVSNAARRNIGRAVVIFKILESWQDKSSGGDTKQLRVAWHIKPVPSAADESGGVDIRALNESSDYEPDSDDAPAKPAPSSRSRSAAKKTTQTKAPAAKKQAEKPADDGNDAALLELLDDEQPTTPHFEDLWAMIAAAEREHGIGQEQVVAAYKSLGFGKGNTKDHDALAQVWAELEALA